MKDLTISPMDARRILVALNKLPSGVLPVETFGAMIRLHQQLMREEVMLAQSLALDSDKADRLAGVCDLSAAMCKQIASEGVPKEMKKDLKERVELLEEIKRSILELRDWTAGEGN